MNRNVITGVAPELRVSQWIDAEGQSIAPLKLSDLGGGFKVIDLLFSVLVPWVP